MTNWQSEYQESEVSRPVRSRVRWHCPFADMNRCSTLYFPCTRILWLLCGLLASAPTAAQDGTELRTTGFLGEEVAYEVIDGLAVYAGDIILGRADEVAAWRARSHLTGMSGIRTAVPTGYRPNGSLCIWPRGVVPYVIDASLSPRQRENVLSAIRIYDARTVLRFVGREPQHQDYMHFVAGPVSGSWICHEGGTGQMTVMVENPDSVGNLLHVLGHAIGLEHENQRRDRDRYLTVFNHNIAATPLARGAWHPRTGQGLDIGPYDYRSVMHYGFLEPLKQRNHSRPYQAETIPPGMPFGMKYRANAELMLSPGDVDSIARLYGHVPSEHVISTNPPGLEIIVDGERMTAPASFRWQLGSEHTLEVPSPQFRPGSRYLFGRWSDDGARSHVITATEDTTLYQASFIAQHQVSTPVSPPGAGSVNVSPPSSDGYYTLRTPVELTASPTSGSALKFMTWNVSTYYDWLIREAVHGPAANPARTVVQPDMIYEAVFRRGPIFRVDSNVDPVAVNVDGYWRYTPNIFPAEGFSGVRTVTARLLESSGRAYRHRFGNWSNGGDITHSIEVPKESDSTLTLTLDTEYRLMTHAWADWAGNSIETVPASQDGFYAEGTQVRLRAVAEPPAKFLGWNGNVAGRDPTATLVMDDGNLAEAVFALDARELRSGVSEHVSLEWRGTDDIYAWGDLDFERFYVQIPPDASGLQVRFELISASPGAEAGLWVSAGDLWPNWVGSGETANGVLGDGVVTIQIPEPRDRWPVAYFILVRGTESKDAGARTVDGTLVATVTRDAERNRAPIGVGTLEDRTLTLGAPALVLDGAQAFSDPDGDVLTYAAVSSSPAIAATTVSGDAVTVTPARLGSATITVTATDPGGLSATQRFAVTVVARTTFTDHPIVPGTTPIRAIHFTELRDRIDALRRRGGLPAFRWTDAVLLAGVTPVRRVHLRELRSALDAVYDAVGRSRPVYADVRVQAGATPIRAAQIMELRAALLRVE